MSVKHVKRAFSEVNVFLSSSNSLKNVFEKIFLSYHKQFKLKQSNKKPVELFINLRLLLWPSYKKTNKLLVGTATVSVRCAIQNKNLLLITLKMFNAKHILYNRTNCDVIWPEPWTLNPEPPKNHERQSDLEKPDWFLPASALSYQYNSDVFKTYSQYAFSFLARNMLHPGPHRHLTSCETAF